MAKRRYVIYCDESLKRGEYYSNFFGGVLLKAEDRQIISELLNEKKAELNLGNELKWQRVTGNYLEKYEEFITYFFEFVSSGRIKVRIMFSQNIHVPVGLSREQIEDTYFRLYYQFIKHAFGIRHCNPNQIDNVYFSLLLDQIPDSKLKTERFKKYLCAIPDTIGLRHLGIHIPIEKISNVDSRDHVILQGLDIILGSMAFRLNDGHRVKLPGKSRRGKRTIAKEKLYKTINKNIRTIYPNFNIGISTGQRDGPADKWAHSYRHWRFVPAHHKVDLEKSKGKAPPKPT